MTIVATERPKLAGSGDSRRLTYYVRDDANAPITPAAAVAEAISEAPSTVDGYPFQSYSYDEISVDKFDVELTYSHQNQNNSPRDVQEGEAQYSFETVLESVHINSSLGRVASHFDSTLQPGLDQSAVDALFPGAINVDADGKAQGFTLQVPISRFSYRYRIPNLTVDAAYQVQVEELTGVVNDDTFKTREAGSVRFDGGRGVQSSDGTWDWDFRFTHRPNISGKTIGGITGIDADGWDLIWPYFIPFRDDDGNLTTNPAYVFVDRIYPRGDLDLLGIP